MSTSFRVARILATLLLVAGGGSAGDRIPREPISGSVVLDGQPLDEGMISFGPLDGSGPAAAAVIQGGNYRIAREVGPSPGLHKVDIRALRTVGQRIPSDDTPGLFIEEKREAVDERFNLKSELKADVKAGGDNLFDYEVKGAAVRAKK